MSGDINLEEHGNIDSEKRCEIEELYEIELVDKLVETYEFWPY